MGCCQSNTATHASAGANGRRAPGGVAEEVEIVEATEAAAAAPTLLEAADEELKEEEAKALHQLRLIFDAVDADKSGSVSKDELTAALEADQNLGGLVKEAGLNDVFFVLNQLDTNENQRISWGEFKAHLKKAAEEEVAENGHIAAATRLAEEKALAQLRAIFDKLDADEDGAVSKSELQARLEENREEDSLGRVIEQASLNPEWSILECLDTNKDGFVTWDEFEAHLRKAAIEVVLEDMATAQCCCCPL